MGLAVLAAAVALPAMAQDARVLRNRDLRVWGEGITDLFDSRFLRSLSEPQVRFVVRCQLQSVAGNNGIAGLRFTQCSAQPTPQLAVTPDPVAFADMIQRRVRLSDSASAAAGPVQFTIVCNSDGSGTDCGIAG